MLFRIMTQHFGISKNKQLANVLTNLHPTVSGEDLLLEINTMMDLVNFQSECLTNYDKFISDASKFVSPRTFTMDMQNKLIILNDDI